MEEPAGHAPLVGAQGCKDLNALSSELTGVLASVLGGLQDRVQSLEERLSTETAGKKAAEKALEDTAARLQKLEYMFDEVYQTQQRLNDASSNLEAQFEIGLADMLTRVKKTEDQVAIARAAEEKARAEREEKEAQARAEKNLGKLRAGQQKKHGVDATIALVQDAATRAREEAAQKRQHGQLIKEWTAMIEARLKAVEERGPAAAPVEATPSGIDVATAEEVAARAAARAAEQATASMRATMLDELSAQAAARVSGQVAAAVSKGVKEHGKQSYDAAVARLDEQDASLRAAVEANAAFESGVNERIAALRSVSHSAAVEASEALSKVRENSASAAEMQSIRERHETLHRDLISLRSANASKCERETLEELKSLLNAEAEARLAALESRLTAERDESVHAAKQQLLERFEAGLAASEGTFEHALTSRLTLLDSQISRKLDSGKEYEKLVEVAIADGSTSKRLKMIEAQMAHLLRLIQQLVDVRQQTPSPIGNDASLSPTSKPGWTSPGQRKLPPAATRAAVLHERPKRETPILAHSGAGIMSSFPSQHQHRAAPVNTPVGERRPASAGAMRRVDSAPATGSAAFDGPDAFVPIKRPTSAKPTQPAHHGHTRIFAAVRTTTPSNSPTKMLLP